MGVDLHGHAVDRGGDGGSCGRAVEQCRSVNRTGHGDGGGGSAAATFTATAGTISSNQPATVTASLERQYADGKHCVGCAGGECAVLQSVKFGDGRGIDLHGNAVNGGGDGGVAVGLSSNVGTLTVPGTVTVAAGSATATFTATAGTISSNQPATVTASLERQYADGEYFAGRGGRKWAFLQFPEPGDRRWIDLHGNAVGGGGGRGNCGGAVEQRGCADRTGHRDGGGGFGHCNLHGDGGNDLEQPDGYGDGLFERHCPDGKYRAGCAGRERAVLQSHESGDGSYLDLHGNAVDRGGDRGSRGGAVEQCRWADSAGQRNGGVRLGHRNVHGDGRNDLEQPDGNGDGFAEWQFADSQHLSGGAGNRDPGVLRAEQHRPGWQLDLHGGAVEDRRPGWCRRQAIEQRGSLDHTRFGDRAVRGEFGNIHGHGWDSLDKSDGDHHGHAEWQFLDGLPQSPVYGSGAGIAVMHTGDADIRHGGGLYGGGFQRCWFRRHFRSAFQQLAIPGRSCVGSDSRRGTKCELHSDGWPHPG